MAIAAYLPTVAVNQFTWRYVIPLLVLAPPAGALGITALRRRAPPDPEDATEPAPEREYQPQQPVLQ